METLTFILLTRFTDKYLIKNLNY